MPTSCHQSFGTMPTIFLWKELNTNDDGFLSTHEQGTGKILEFVLGSHRFSRCHGVPT